MTNEQHAQTLEEIAARWQTTWPYESAALRAGAAALRAPQGWQPIATAPKDGTRFLGTDGVDVWVVAASGRESQPWAAVPGWSPRQPTHFQPLPLPPVSPATEQE